MKAIILAGGLGTRLHPLTLQRPKPMLPVANAPLMEHIVRLLARHGWRDITATLQYMPECIQRHFGDGQAWGVTLNYHVEREPLGTAGGVRALINDLADLDQTFLIISGDALTDFDLSALLDFHRRRGALVTMALRRVEDTRQFGVVEVDEEGRVLRFQEKPAPEEAFSDLVNTGIYVMEGWALAAVPAGAPWDFARNLFPMLLERGERIYGCVLPGYWCDIGTPENYLQANGDCLSGMVDVEVRGRYTGNGVWLGEGAELGPGVSLQGPALLGPGVRVEAGASIGPFAVLGPGCHVQAGARLEAAVVWDGVMVTPRLAGSRVVAYGSEAMRLAGSPAASFAPAALGVSGHGGERVRAVWP